MPDQSGRRAICCLTKKNKTDEAEPYIALPGIGFISLILVIVNDIRNFVYYISFIHFLHIQRYIPRMRLILP